MTTDIPSQIQKAHFVFLPAIDGLRGISILMVCFFHFYWNNFPNTERPGWIFHFAQGVPLFFIISGFLISNSYKKFKASPMAVWAFYIRRIFRTYPLYLVLVLISAIYHKMNFAEIISYLTFSFGFKPRVEALFYLSVTWSLFCEEIFYLFFPLIDRLTHSVVMASGFFIIALLIKTFFQGAALTLFNLTPILSWQSPLAYLPFFSSGILIFRMYDRGIFSNLCLMLNSTLSSILMNIILLFVLYLFYRGSYSLLMGSVVLLLVLFNNWPLAEICRRPWLQFIGVMCYPIYLFHNPIEMEFAKIIPVSSKDWLQILCFFILEIFVMVLLLYPVHRWIERPLNNVGVEIGRKLSRISLFYSSNK